MFFSKEKPSNKRILDVGWVIDPVPAGVLWDAPSVLKYPMRKEASAKAVQSCPAVLQNEMRLLEVPCPIDAQISIKRDMNGRWMFNNDLGKDSPIAVEKLDDMLVLMPVDHWRHPDRPVIQIHTPYRFVVDETCVFTQLPPIRDYKGDRWPGLLIGGRFPLQDWPRRMMWAFEWYDTSKPLILKRGEPWFYIRFDGFNPERPIRMVEAEYTDELRDYCRQVDAVTNYVSQTFSLFSKAKARRPKQLLVRKKR